MKKINLHRKTDEVVLIKDDGTEDKLEIREMTALQRDQYMDLLLERMQYNSEGKFIGIKKYDGMQTDLLTRCLYRSGTLLSLRELQEMPFNVVSELYEEAQKLNNVNPNSEEVTKAKNDSQVSGESGIA